MITKYFKWLAVWVFATFIVDYFNTGKPLDTLVFNIVWHGVVLAVVFYIWAFWKKIQESKQKEDE